MMNSWMVTFLRAATAMALMGLPSVAQSDQDEFVDAAQIAKARRKLTDLAGSGIRLSTDESSFSTKFTCDLTLSTQMEDGRPHTARFRVFRSGSRIVTVVSFERNVVYAILCDNDLYFLAPDSGHLIERGESRTIELLVPTLRSEEKSRTFRLAISGPGLDSKGQPSALLPSRVRIDLSDICRNIADSGALLHYNPEEHRIVAAKNGTRPGTATVELAKDAESGAFPIKSLHMKIDGANELRIDRILIGDASESFSRVFSENWLAERQFKVDDKRLDFAETSDRWTPILFGGKLSEHQVVTGQALFRAILGSPRNREQNSTSAKSK